MVTPKTFSIFSFILLIYTAKRLKFVSVNGVIIYVNNAFVPSSRMALVGLFLGQVAMVKP